MHVQQVFLSYLFAAAAAVPASPLTPRDEPQEKECQKAEWQFNEENYREAHTRSQLQTYWQGGVDRDGIEWPGVRDKTDDFSAKFASDMMDLVWSCKTISLPCEMDSWTCKEIGALDDSNNLVRSHWAWQAANSMASMSQVLHRVWDRLDGALNQNLANSWTAITEFMPSPDDPIYTKTKVSRGIGAGVGMAASIIREIVPQPVGAVFSVLSAISSGSQASVALAVADETLRLQNLQARDFDKVAGNMTKNLQAALDTYNRNMFGAVVDPNDYSVDLFSAIDEHGDALWVNTTTITDTEIHDSLIKLIFSLVLNDSWKAKRVFVTFADLQDDEDGTKCKADNHGPEISKYCADGGVYYLLRWGDGMYAEPWGVDKLKDSYYGIDPKWITESSARMYRLLVENGKSPYSTDGDEQLDVVKNVKGFTDADGLAAIPRVPGVWNLPVCDMGPHVDWNSKNPAGGGEDFVAPCYCGTIGEYTEGFWNTVLQDGVSKSDCKISRICSWQGYGMFEGKKNWPEELDNPDDDNQVSKMGDLGEIHEGQQYRVYNSPECNR